MADFLDRRAFDRVHVRLDVTVVGPAGRRLVQATDVSVGGLRIDTASLKRADGPPSAKPVLFPGAMVSVEFLTHEDVPVQVFARVRWLNEERAGLGLEFLDPPPDARSAISGFVATLRGAGR